MNITADFTLADFDRAAIDAGKQIDRVRWELTLLSIVAAEPRHRWQMAVTLGMKPTDFSADDSQTIYAALRVGHEHGRRICALLTRNLLVEHRLWDDADLRPFVAGSVFGPGPLASFFTRAMNLDSPATDIAIAIGHVRSLPKVPSLKVRAA